MDAKLPDIAVAEHLAERIVAVDAGTLPAAAREKCEETLIDVVGLCLAARNEDYVRSALDGWDDDGPCTAIGHKRTLSAAGAAFVNGTAAHGEDFDDTFEGGPVHAGAVIVPAVLAACERHGVDGKAALEGIAVGIETDVPARPGRAEDGAQGRLPSDRGVRRDGRGGRASARRSGSTRSRSSTRSASSARMASGIIEYLAEGTWTKRMHAGWAAQSGMRAALLARAGFSGPRTVFEGVHGFFHGFANTTKGDFDALTGDFGTRWVTQTLAFKLYPCGTMTHPYIDCARRLGAARHQGRRHRGDGLRRRRGHRAPAVGAARRQADAEERLRRQILHALLHRRGLRARQRGLERFHRRGGEGAGGRGARQQGPLPDRSEQSLSQQLHRPHPRDACATAA